VPINVSAPVSHVPQPVHPNQIQKEKQGEETICEGIAAVMSFIGRYHDIRILYSRPIVRALTTTMPFISCPKLAWCARSLVLSGWFGFSILRIDVGLDGSLEGLGVGADNLSNLVAALEKQEGGHSADAEFLRNVGDFVDVELAGSSAQRCGSLLYDLGRNDLTRAAPCREAVKHHERLLLAERLVECRLAVIPSRQSAPKTYDVVHLMRDTTELDWKLTSGGCVRPAFPRSYWLCCGRTFG
jgi:hypothetical protein